MKAQHPSSIGKDRVGLLAGEKDTTRHEPIMRRVNTSQHAFAISVGTAAKRMADIANVIRGQESYASSLAGEAALFTTATDFEGMRSRLYVPDDEPVILSRDDGVHRVAVHHEGRASLISEILETMSNIEGFGSQPLLAADTIVPSRE